tara:strand:- start:342 stop:788 length:447 start_codon:yes stop_codon:yes gene_type:complete
MTKDFIAKRMTPNSKSALQKPPIWDLFNNQGEDIGCLTGFDGEGFVATVKDKTGNTITVDVGPSWKSGTIRECLAKAREALITLQAEENLDLLTTEEMTPAQLERDLKEYTAFHAIECNWDKETCELHYDMQDIEPRNESVLLRRKNR